MVAVIVSSVAHVGHWGGFYYTMGTFTPAGTGDLAAAVNLR